MATHEEWKKLTQQKIEVVRRMMTAKEWLVAAEYMGYTLECALKATCCKSLHISDYPPVKTRAGGRNEELGYFRTHDFDSLLIFSGLSDLLGNNSMTWGVFTPEYVGDWPQIIRYDHEAGKKFTETKVKELYDVLYHRDDSIIKTIFKEKRW